MSVSPSPQPARSSAPQASAKYVQLTQGSTAKIRNPILVAIVIIPALYGYMQSGLNSAWKFVPQAAEPAPATA